METILVSSAKEARKCVSQKLVDECHPYTNNHYLFENHKKLRMKDVKERVKSSAFKATEGEVVLVDTVVRIVDTLFDSMSCDEHMAQEIDFGLRAYGKVAVKRIIDDIPMIIDRCLLMDIPDQIMTRHLTDLQLTNILAEHSATNAYRADLKLKVKKMEKAKEAIRSILAI